MHPILVQFLCVLFLLLLYVYVEIQEDDAIDDNNEQKGSSSSISSEPDEHLLSDLRNKFLPTDALNQAVEMQDLQAVRDYISQSEKVFWLDMDRTPLTILAEIHPDDWTPARQAILDYILALDITVNNGFKKKTPLEIAASKRNHHVFRALLEYPGSVKVVRPVYLDCGVISWVTTKFGPNSVKYVVPLGENTGISSCFVGLPDFMKVPSANELVGETVVILKKTKLPKDGNSPITVSLPEVDPSDPFTPLPPNIYPPRGRNHFVLNPSPFSSIVTASLYYLTGISFFGIPPSNWSWDTLLAVIYLGISLLMCLIAVGLLVSVKWELKKREREAMMAVNADNEANNVREDAD